MVKTLKEACEFAEAGFGYINIEWAQIFRKRK